MKKIAFTLMFMMFAGSSAWAGTVYSYCSCNLIGKEGSRVYSVQLKGISYYVVRGVSDPISHQKIEDLQTINFSTIQLNLKDALRLCALAHQDAIRANLCPAISR